MQPWGCGSSKGVMRNGPVSITPPGTAERNSIFARMAESGTGKFGGSICLRSTDWSCCCPSRAGPVHRQLGGGHEGRREEGEALHVVPVQVREEHRRLHRRRLDQRVTQAAQAGARVEDQPVALALQLQARGIPANLRDV